MQVRESLNTIKIFNTFCAKISPKKPLSHFRTLQLWFQDKLFWCLWKLSAQKASKLKSWWANMLTKAWWTQRLWEPCWLRRAGPLMELALYLQCTCTWTCTVLALCAHCALQSQAQVGIQDVPLLYGEKKRLLQPVPLLEKYIKQAD